MLLLLTITKFIIYILYSIDLSIYGPTISFNFIFWRIGIYITHWPSFFSSNLVLNSKFLFKTSWIYSTSFKPRTPQAAEGGRRPRKSSSMNNSLSCVAERISRHHPFLELPLFCLYKINHNNNLNKA